MDTHTHTHKWQMVKQNLLATFGGTQIWTLKIVGCVFYWMAQGLNAKNTSIWRDITHAYYFSWRRNSKSKTNPTMQRSSRGKIVRKCVASLISKLQLEWKQTNRLKQCLYMMVANHERKEIQLNGVRTVALNTHIGWPLQFQINWNTTYLRKNHDS